MLPTREQVEERRLPGAGPADQADHLAGAKLEVDALQRVDLFGPAPVGLHQGPAGQDGVRRRAGASRADRSSRVRPPPRSRRGVRETASGPRGGAGCAPPRRSPTAGGPGGSPLRARRGAERGPGPKPGRRRVVGGDDEGRAAGGELVTEATGAAAVSLSSSAVGSSATTRAGAPTTACANASRCCSPPDSCRGRL